MMHRTIPRFPVVARNARNCFTAAFVLLLDLAVTTAIAIPESEAEAPWIAETGDFPPLVERLPPADYSFMDEHAAGQYLAKIKIVGGGNSVDTVDCDGDKTPVRSPRSISVDERLTILTESGYVANVARDFEFDGERTVDVFLRRSKWSDGTLVTADDIEFSLEIIEYDVHQPLMNFIDHRPVAETIEEDHIRIIFSNRVAEVGFLLSQIEIYPAHTAKSLLDRTKGANNDGWTHVFRSCARRASISPTLGAYALVSYNDVDRELTFRANPYYFKIDSEGRQQPYFETAEYTVTSDVLRQTLRELQEASSVPLVVELPFHAIDFASIAALIRGGELQISRQPFPGRGSAAAYFFNYADETYGELFRTRDFRRATSDAIDRDEIVETVFQPLLTGVEPQIGIFGPRRTDREADRDAHAAPDPLSALWPHDKPITVTIAVSGHDPTAVATAEMIAQSWSDIDIEAEIRMESYWSIYHSEKQHEFDVILRSFYLPEAEMRLNPGWIVPPFREPEILATAGVYGEVCESSCDPIELAESVQRWYDMTHGMHRSDDAYKTMTSEMLTLHEDTFLAIGIVSPLPDIYLIGKQLTDLQSKMRRGAHNHYVSINE